MESSNIKNISCYKRNVLSANINSELTIVYVVYDKGEDCRIDIPCVVLVDNTKPIYLSDEYLIFSLISDNGYGKRGTSLSCVYSLKNKKYNVLQDVCSCKFSYNNQFVAILHRHRYGSGFGCRTEDEYKLVIYEISTLRVLFTHNIGHTDDNLSWEIPSVFFLD